MWILHQLNETLLVIDKSIASYRLNDAAKAAYEFFWDDFCDWYIEASKISLYSDNDSEKDRAITILIHVLSETLRILHPFLSFITEEIYLKLPVHDPSIVNSAYPEYNEKYKNYRLAENVKLLQELIRSVRTLRSEFTIPPSKKIRVKIKFDSTFSAGEFFINRKELIKLLISASDVSFIDTRPSGSGNIPAAGTGYEVFADIKDAVDIPKEIEKLNKEIEKSQKLLERTENKLKNPEFIKKARADIIEKEKAAQEELNIKIMKTKSYLAELS